MDVFESRRHAMVDSQLVPRGIRDSAVLDAMRAVPRELFVPPSQVSFAYQDRPLPIENGQTISQPYIVAFMTEAAGISQDARVLEIGTGSGYAAAVLAAIAAQVYTIERHPALAQSAQQRFEKLGVTNVTVIAADGTLGLPTAAPFDAILATAAGPLLPPPLLQQLTIGGRLVMPVERRYGHQQLTIVERVAEEEYREQDLLGVAFVPLIGRFGHPDIP
jgi:protein-L-isoaspartate(D-aspartate) O-methyltransferase